MLLTAEKSELLLIDFQQKLMPAMHDGPSVTSRAARLATAARLVGVPVRATEQNPDKLGPTVPELAGFAELTVPKTAFAATGQPEFAGALGDGRDVVVAGCEAHVCVLQTVLELLGPDRRVIVVTDAIGSRDPADKAAAVTRMSSAGAEFVTSEMVLFEWLRDSTHPAFRDVQKLIK